MKRRIDPTTLLIIIISSVMTITMVVLLVFVIKVMSGGDETEALIQQEIQGEDEDSSFEQSLWWGTAPLLCNPYEGQPDQCPPDCLCISGRCDFTPPPKPAKEGESCRETHCEDGLTCYRNKCVSEVPEEVPDVCTDSEVLRAIQKLTTKCEKRAKQLDDIKGEGCSGEDWKELALEDENFDVLLAVFPSRVAIHFPIARPSSRRPDWGRSKKKLYVKELDGLEFEDPKGEARTFRQELQDAEQIFVIGRASPDGNPDLDYQVATMRMDFAQQMLVGMFDQSQAREINLKIRYWSLGGARPLSHHFFREKYADASVAWSKDSRKKLERLLAKDPSKLTTREEQWLAGVVNRITLIIPIPCKLDQIKG